MNVCIFGAASGKIDRAYIDETEEICRALALRGHDLIFGGGATGMMGAAARGFAKGNAKITGVAPSFFNKPGILYEDCSELVLTETMRERKQYMEEHADLFLVLPGGIGTLDEFFEAFTLRSLGRHKKPVVLLNVRGYFDELLLFFDKMLREGFIDREVRDDLRAASCEKQLFKILDDRSLFS